MFVQGFCQENTRKTNRCTAGAPRPPCSSQSYIIITIITTIITIVTIITMSITMNITITIITIIVIRGMAMKIDRTRN